MSGRPLRVRKIPRRDRRRVFRPGPQRLAPLPRLLLVAYLLPVILLVLAIGGIAIVAGRLVQVIQRLLPNDLGRPAGPGRRIAVPILVQQPSRPHLGDRNY